MQRRITWWLGPVVTRHLGEADRVDLERAVGLDAQAQEAFVVLDAGAEKVCSVAEWLSDTSR